MSSSSKTKILFDGNCIVCDLEIHHYKKIAPELFEIEDIAHPQFNAKKYGLTSQEVNGHMHVITRDGEVQKGVDAFIVIWSQLPFYKIFSKIIHLPVIYPLAKIGYAIFAKYRHLLPKKRRVQR